MKKFINKTIKPLAIWLSRKSSLADSLIKGILESSRRNRFTRILKQIPEDSQTVLFVSFMGRSFSDSPKIIFEGMLSNPKFQAWNFIWAFVDPDSSEFTEKYAGNERIRSVKYESINFLKALAEAKYWVSNTHIPDGIYPPASKTYLQTWHGTPIKKIGADIDSSNAKMPKKSANLGKWYNSQASKWTHLLSQSSYFTEKMTSAFRLNELQRPPEIIFEGSPRNTPLTTASSKAQAHIQSKLGIPTNKKVALYAPTFRDNQHSSTVGYTYNLGLNLNKLQQDIGDEWVILFRTHYFVANSIDLKQFKGFVWDVSNYEDINDLYIASDTLITDYSSSMVDYSVLNKPILIYAYDLNEYENELRGFYIPTQEFPGPILKTQAELVSAIINLPELEDSWMPVRKVFAQKFAPKDDSGTASRVINRIFK